MKRFGFTLPEAMIAMTILGVIAAITFPLIRNMMPDKDKAIVLKAYNALYEANNDIFNNPSLYDPTCKNGNGGNPTPVLQCTANPLDSANNTAHGTANYQGNAKYPNLLTEHLELSNTISLSGNNYTFTAADGVAWTLTPVLNSGALLVRYEIVINTGNMNRDNCAFSATCGNPRQFLFRVDENGILSPNDNLTRAYLMTPDRLNNRSEDLRTAKSL